MASLDIGQASLCFKIVSTSLDKQRVLSMLLHSCDVSHPAKMWQLHSQWTTRLVTVTILTMSIVMTITMMMTMIAMKTMTTIMTVNGDNDHSQWATKFNHDSGAWRSSSSRGTRSRSRALTSPHCATGRTPWCPSHR